MEKTVLCQKCSNQISKNFYYNHNVLNEIKKDHENIKNIFFIDFYKEILKNNILELKYSKNKFFLRYFLKIILSKFNLKSQRYDAVLYIPSYKQRKFHSYTFVKTLSAILGVRFLDEFIIKIKDNKEQKDLKYHEKYNNVKDCFCLNEDVFLKKKSKILLFDDIITTGFTIRSILELLSDYKVDLVFLAVSENETVRKTE